MQHPPAHTNSQRRLEPPFPPRYWWLKRILLTAVAIVLLVSAMRCWWGYEAQRRLDAKIAEIRTRGEPLLPEDFPPSPSIPDEDNAVFYLTDAVRTSRQTWTALLGDADAASANIAEVLEAAQQIIEENDQSLRLVRTARTRHGVDWGVDLSAGLCDAREPELFTIGLYGSSPSFLFGDFLADVASYHHHIGDDVEAVECLRDAIHYCEVVETAPHIAGLWATKYTIYRMCVVLPHIARNLRVTDEQAASSGAAQRADVSALIAALLDEDLRRRYLSSAWLRRARSLEYWRGKADGETRSGNAPEPMLERILLRPAALLDMVRLLDEYESGISVFEEPLAIHIGLPDVEELPRKRKLLATLRRQVTHKYERGLMASSEWAPGNESCLWSIAWRRIMATRLALRLYELDHGTNPALLANLVPEYLSAVPLDPYFADGRELTLSCEGTRWLLQAGHAGGSGQPNIDLPPCQMWLTPEIPASP